MPKASNKSLKRRIRNKRRQQNAAGTALGTKIAAEKRAAEAAAPTTMDDEIKQDERHLDEIQPSFEQYRKSWDLWRRTYETAIRWHNQHQTNFWRQRAMTLQKENEELRLKARLKYYADQYETSSEEDEEEEEEEHVGEKSASVHDGGGAVKPEIDGGGAEIDGGDVEQPEIDEDYLDFVTVTLKHREELQLAREKLEMESGV